MSRLRAEGAIVLGLTNVPEMGRGGESNNNLYGRTNNPWSVGSDGGGSIRQPCHNTGIAGLKPTHGRIPRTGSVFADALGVFGPFNCYGPLARTVADLHLGLSIMNGPDLRDPYAVPAPLGRPQDVDLGSLRVATYLDDGISPPAGRCRDGRRSGGAGDDGGGGGGRAGEAKLRGPDHETAVGVWEDATALAVAGHLERVFGGWQAPPPIAA